MIDWLNDNSGAVQAVSAAVLALTFIAVAYYALQTRMQAEASERMAEEMREQRLGERMPILLIDLIDFNTGGNRPGEGVKVEDCYPGMLKARLINVGSGPAIDVNVIAIHPKANYWRSATKGYLLPNESMEYDTTESIYEPSGRGLYDLLADCDIQLEPRYDVGIVASYRDVHERTWVAWMSLDYDSDLGGTNNEQVIWWLNEAGQHTAQVPNGRIKQSAAIFLGVGTTHETSSG